MKAVIFDMDGVLVESMKYHIRSWEKAFEEYEISPTDEDLALREGMSYRETINSLCKKYSAKLSSEQKERIHSLKKEFMGKIHRFEIYKDVLPLLKILESNSMALALVTGADKEFESEVINAKFNNFFKVIITGDDVEHGKPSPEPYLAALKKLRVRPGDAVVIENSPLGIESAKSAGITVFALTTTLDRKHLKKADRIFSSHKELLAFFENLFSEKAA